MKNIFSIGYHSFTKHWLEANIRLYAGKWYRDNFMIRIIIIENMHALDGLSYYRNIFDIHRRFFPYETWQANNNIKLFTLNCSYYTGGPIVVKSNSNISLYDFLTLKSMDFKQPAFIFEV
jgi:hypothetical protein